MKKKSIGIMIAVIIVIAAAACVYHKWLNDASSHPVIYAVSLEEARDSADSGEGCFIVGCGYSTGYDYFIAHGENKGALVLLTGNVPDGALNRYTFLHGTGNKFLIKGMLSERASPDKYQMELEVEAWDFIAPITRNYDDTYGRTGKTRWFTPKDYIDDFDIENGDFYMTPLFFPQLASRGVILPPRDEIAFSELPVITLPEDLLTYEKGAWPQFYPTPDGDPIPHPFDGCAAFNAFYADLNCDGVYEAYATIHLGSGIVTSYLLGYDPVTDKTYELNERMIVEYDFIVQNGELLVSAAPSPYTFDESELAADISPTPPEGNPLGTYRPILNPETLTFDLEELGNNYLKEADGISEIQYSNPIDAYYLPRIASPEAEVARREYQDTYRGVWQSEYENILAWMKEKCVYQEDIDRLNEYAVAVEALIEATRPVLITDWLEDYELPPDDPDRGVWGNGTRSSLNQMQGDIYRDAGMRLIGYYDDYVFLERDYSALLYE